MLNMDHCLPGTTYLINKFASATPCITVFKLQDTFISIITQTGSLAGTRPNQAGPRWLSLLHIPRTMPSRPTMAITTTHTPYDAKQAHDGYHYYTYRVRCQAGPRWLSLLHIPRTMPSRPTMAITTTHTPYDAKQYIY